MLAPEVCASLASLTAQEFQRVWGRLPDEEAQRAVLYERCRTDRRLFARTFFPERFDLEWSPVQQYLLAAQLPAWRDRAQQTRRRWVAPRGSAKSSIASFLEPLHDILYGREVCIHVYSTGYRLAELLVKDLHAVLSDPPALIQQVFGDIALDGTQTNFVARVENAEPLGTAVVAMSFGGDARGYKHAGKRPSKFVLDDTVNPKHIKNPDQREAQWKFLQRDIGRAGWRYSSYVLVGTVQHPDDLVARVGKAPDWTGKTWKNLIKWPANMALWEQCRKIWADLSDPLRIEHAAEFYGAHRAEMDLGAEVLWPAGRSLWELMQTFWASPGAFWTEDQNEPREAGDSIFAVERWKRCIWDRDQIRTSRGTTVPLSKCQIALWLDPSSGGKKNDFPAIAVVARDPQQWRYLLAVQMLRKPPNEQQAALWSLWERLAAYAPLVGIDETGTQALLGEAFERQREERRRKGVPWNMPVKGYHLQGDKNDRISRLQPDLELGWMEVVDDLAGEVVEQFRDFPNATHDDGPDAVERADWLLSKTPTISSTIRG